MTRPDGIKLSLEILDHTTTLFSGGTCDVMVTVVKKMDTATRVKFWTRLFSLIVLTLSGNILIEIIIFHPCVNGNVDWIFAVIYDAFGFDVAQHQMNGAPNETRTHP